MVEKQFPPEGFVPTQSAVDGIVVYMPAPPIDTTADDTQIVEFKCPTCGSETAYSISSGALSCTTCGYYQQPKGKRVGRGASAEEFRLTPKANANPIPTPVMAFGAATIGAQAATERSSTTPNDDFDWGAARNALDCNDCGAQLLLDPEQLTHTCPFCGSSKVYQHVFANDKMRPGYLIPFQLEQKAASVNLLKWLGTTWLVPNDLSSQAGVQRLVGVYVPFWTFTAQLRGNWRAEIGRNRTERYYSDGEWKSRTVTDWTWESGSNSRHYQDVLVPGTGKIAPALIDEFETYSMNGLVEYDPSYLAGFDAQTHDIDRDQAWVDGRAMMNLRLKDVLYGDAQKRGDRVRSFSMSADFSEERWRHILAPMYLATYRYGDDAYTVLVNGQTGECAGERPVSVWKKRAAQGGTFFPALLFLILMAFFAHDIDYWLWNNLSINLDERLPIVILGLTLLLLALGGFLSFRIQQYADKVQTGDFK